MSAPSLVEKMSPRDLLVRLFGEDLTPGQKMDAVLAYRASVISAVLEAMAGEAWRLADAVDADLDENGHCSPLLAFETMLTAFRQENGIE